MNNKTKSLSKNTIFYLIYNVVNALFPFITGLYVTHVLLPGTIGNVEFARNLVQYFVIIAFLGIPTYGLREISKYRNNKESLNKIYSELMVINFISTLFFLITYLTLIICIGRFNNDLCLYAVVGISLALNFLNNSWLFEGLEEFKYISIRNIVFKALSFLLLILFVKSDQDYLMYGLITVVGTYGNYILNIIYCRKFVTFSLKELNLKRHMKSISYLVVVNLAIEIYTLVDVTMLGILNNNDTVAYYSYGVKINKILLQIVNTFTMVLVPRIAFFYKEKNINGFNKLIRKTLITIILITLPVIIGINYTAPFIITKLYGLNYIRSANVLKLISLVLIISPIGYLLGSRVLLSTNNENKMIIPVSLGALINIILNYFFIRLFNEMGAALASVLSELIVMFIYILLGKKYIKLDTFGRNLFKIVGASFIMLLFLMTIQTKFIDDMYVIIVKIIGAIIVYFTSLYVLKEEIVMDVLKKIKKKVKIGVR